MVNFDHEKELTPEELSDIELEIVSGGDGGVLLNAGGRQEPPPAS